MFSIRAFFTFGISALLGSINAHASDLLHLPHSFSYQDSKAVFADFENVEYDITYDQSTRIAKAIATITFQTNEPGHPVFDCISTPTRITLDKVSVNSSLIETPNAETNIRVLDSLVQAGSHTMKIEVPIGQLTEFANGGTKSAFWMTDRQDRGYLERYLPTNFIFDRMRITMHVHFTGNTLHQRIYTNGLLKEVRNNDFLINYPPYYTASSIYFHTTPENSMDENSFKFRSSSGKDVPVVIYTQKSSNSQKQLLIGNTKAFAELTALEARFGAYPHPSLTIYLARGRMEYCGAMMTTMSAMNHELFHSYFGRGLMPADGNAGWIDEALAVWHDNDYPTAISIQGRSRMAGHPYYTRATDTDAYDFGANFMAYLEGKFASQGGLTPFLNSLLRTRLFTPFVTSEFNSMMNEFYKTSVDIDFKHYVYGMETGESDPGSDVTYAEHIGTDTRLPDLKLIHPIHNQITSVEELKKLL